jgi:hypothetical protein
MCFFGLLHERLNEGKVGSEVNWEAFYMGCFAGAVPWAAIFAYLGLSPALSQVPAFAWGVISSAYRAAAD